MPGESVYRICEDQDGYLWLGTGKSGLFGFDKNKGIFRQYNLPVRRDRLTGSVVYMVEEDSHGTLWVGDVSEEGTLFRRNTLNESFESFLEGYRIVSFYEDSSGWYWAGTENQGVLHFNKDKSNFRQYTVDDGLPSNTVVGILEAPPGTFWLATHRGLSKFDPESSRFTSKGLPSHRFDKATHIASDGELYFGGSSVLFSFFPEKTTGNQIPPKILVSGLRVSGVPYDLDISNPADSEKIILAHSQNDVTFEYIGFISAILPGINTNISWNPMTLIGLMLVRVGRHSIQISIQGHIHFVSSDPTIMTSGTKKVHRFSL